MSWRVVAAWGVHLYTALGVPLGVWAIFAIVAGDARTAWLLIWATIFLDSTDGILARAVRVWEALPWVDGRRLDDIVDYFTWVIVPMVLLVQWEMAPAWVVVGPLIASGYGFAQVQAKTDDAYFLGFPSYWSMLVYYLYLLESPVWFNVAMLLLGTVLVFVPIKYPYPTKLPAFRALTLALGALWGFTMIGLTFTIPNWPNWLVWVSLLYPFYYLGLTVLLWLQRRTAAHSSTHASPH